MNCPLEVVKKVLLEENDDVVICSPETFGCIEIDAVYNYSS